MTDLLTHIPVVILAGGLGMRLRPILPDRPKGLAPIGACSFLEIQIKLLRDQGAKHFVLCIGHQGDQIQAALVDGRGLAVEIDYSIEEDRLLGTAGALKEAAGYFTPRALVLNGDTYFPIDYNKFVQHHLEEHQRCGAMATLALSQASGRARYGNVLLDSLGRRVVSFREKEIDPSEGSGWVSAGAYVIERELLGYVPPGQPCSLEREVFPRVLTNGRTLAAVTFADRFFDIGTPDGWRIFTGCHLEQQRGRRFAADPTTD